MNRDDAPEQQAFVEKLNDFLQTLDAQEQEWLAALVTRGSAQDDVQGYDLPGAAGALGMPTTDLPVIVADRAGGSGQFYLVFTFKLVAVKTISWSYD